MKKFKLLSVLLAVAFFASQISMPITANAAINLYYDMDTSDVAGFRQNQGADGTRSQLMTDPEDSSNKVWGVKTVKIDNVDNIGSILIDQDLPDEKYLQIEFDLYKEAADSFQADIYDKRGWGTRVAALYLDSNGKVYCRSVEGGTYTAKKWYTFKIVLNFETTKYMLWMKEKGEEEYRYVAEYDATSNANTNQTFSKTEEAGQQGLRIRLSSGSDYSYVDNLKISSVDKLSIHYEFNNVTTKVAKPYFNWGSNCTNANGSVTWSQAEFDGQQVLKGAVTATDALQPYTSDKLPDMDRVVIEARLGHDGTDSEGNLGTYLPYEFGIIPVFADANGNKNVSGYSERTGGIKFSNTRAINVEGIGYSKTPGTDTQKGYNLANGKLYTAGYVYDRINKIYKAYFITNNGETIVRDVSSNAFVQAQRNLAGVQLWLRAQGTQLVCNGYYDYLRIDEPSEFIKTAVEPVGNVNNMSLKPQIKIDYSNIIDPTALSSATAYFTPKNASGDEGRVNASLDTYNGKTLMVTPQSTLDVSTEYVMTVSGVTDLLGQNASEVTQEFTTGKLINSSEITLANGRLADGENTAKVTLSSNDGAEHDAVLIAAVYDNTTDRFISAFVADKQTITTASKEFSVSFDTTGYSNYKVKVFVWSELDKLIPYIDNAPVFTK